MVQAMSSVSVRGAVAMGALVCLHGLVARSAYYRGRRDAARELLQRLELLQGLADDEPPGDA